MSNEKDNSGTMAAVADANSAGSAAATAATSATATVTAPSPSTSSAPAPPAPAPAAAAPTPAASGPSYWPQFTHLTGYSWALLNAQISDGAVLDSWLADCDEHFIMKAGKRTEELGRRKEKRKQRRREE